MTPLYIIGYSGHGYVACDIFQAMGRQVSGYFDLEEKTLNPFGLNYLGDDRSAEALQLLQNSDYFVSIGDNLLRRRVYERMGAQAHAPVNALHPSAVISPSAQLGNGVMAGARAVIQAVAEIGNGVIINTGAIVEHECRIGAFAHIAPGAVLTGNVRVGENAFVGAGAVVIPGVCIGHNAVIGAGAVVIRDVPDGAKVLGNPGREG